MPYKIEPLPDSELHLGEGPHWDIETQSLYLVDLKSGKIVRFDFEENKTYKCEIENEKFASFIIPVEGQCGQFVVGCSRRVVIVNWNGISPKCKVDKVLFEVEQEDEKFAGNRFNDAKCDPKGRLFAGTMRDIGNLFEFRCGSLYKYMGEGNVETVIENIGISNGLAWDVNLNKFYYIDSTEYDVKSYDYDIKTGCFSNQTVIYDFRAHCGKAEPLVPDGMTIDTDGNLYVATFNGSTIFKINPITCESELEIKLPCEHITSAAFGGPDLDILFVTSAVEGDKNPLAGTTFKVTGLSSKGMPMTKLQLC